MSSGRAYFRWQAMLLALQVSLAPLLAAPPANDGFSNRFAIVSSPTVVTTSLAEATIDPWSPEWVERYYDGQGGSAGGSFPPGIGSLWWTATLTNACSLTIEFLEVSAAERIAVWEHVWGGSYWFGGVWASGNTVVGKVPYTTARTYGPTNFDLQLTGNAPSVALRFTIHTAPLIIIPPQSRTVSPGESVFFGVAATGHSALQYQWLHNGEPMPGETFPMLAFDHVSSSNAGTYRAIITDDLGTNTAEVTLTVSETDVPPRWRTLQRISTNEWSGWLVAEAGRSYRIETSTDLMDWSPLTRLVQESSVKYGTAGTVSNNGVVFLPNARSEVRFRTASSHEFFRAVRHEPSNLKCMNNLKKFRFAKELWAYSFLASSSGYPSPVWESTPTDLDLVPMARGYKFQCPSGGIYTLGRYESQSSCTVHSPLLEPNW